jgi:RNA polymerase sigma-70 factor (ECF subfamily)
MDQSEFESHLSRIDTQWTMVFRAHQGPSDAAAEAQRTLMLRYRGAVHRYLLASLHDPEAAEELSQEFALRFLRGDFRNADPGRGRFRDFIKRAIYHLIVDHHRARKRRPGSLPDECAEVADEDETPPSLQEHDERFRQSWRAELMGKAWAELDELQAKSGRPFAAVLRLRVDQPSLSSAEMATTLSERLGRTVNAAWVRQNLLRARDLFVESLLREVARSLEEPTTERLEEELEELGLLEHCKSALKRRREAT